jgi:hypothetical protein
VVPPCCLRPPTSERRVNDREAKYYADGEDAYDMRKTLLCKADKLPRPERPLPGRAERTPTPLEASHQPWYSSPSSSYLNVWVCARRICACLLSTISAGMPDQQSRQSLPDTLKCWLQCSVFFSSFRPVLEICMDEMNQHLRLSFAVGTPEPKTDSEESAPPEAAPVPSESSESAGGAVSPDTEKRAKKGKLRANGRHKS